VLALGAEPAQTINHHVERLFRSQMTRSNDVRAISSQSGIAGVVTSE
jgi:hypothetical protein